MDSAGHQNLCSRKLPKTSGWLGPSHGQFTSRWTTIILQSRLGVNVLAGVVEGKYVPLDVIKIK